MRPSTERQLSVFGHRQQRVAKGQTTPLIRHLRAAVAVSHSQTHYTPASHARPGATGRTDRGSNGAGTSTVTG